MIVEDGDFFSYFYFDVSTDLFVFYISICSFFVRSVLFSVSFNFGKPPEISVHKLNYSATHRTFYELVTVL